MKTVSEEITISYVFKQLSTEVNKGITFIESADDMQYYTYAAFFDKVACCLHKLIESGIAPGEEVVIQVEDSASFLTIFWACIMGKIIPIPLSVGNQPEQKRKSRRVWKQLSNPWLVASKQTIKHFLKFEGEDREIISQMLDRSVNLDFVMTPGKKYFSDIPVSSEEIAYIQYSSGSTGTPKGVMLTHGNLFANVSAILKRSGTTKDDSMLSWMPLSHDMGMLCFHMCGIFAGVHQYIMPTNLFVRRPLLWMNIVSEKKISQLYSPNFGLQFFLTALRKGGAPDWDLSAIRILFNGAEQISARVCMEFAAALSTYHLKPGIMYPSYGLAEASVAVSMPDAGDEVRSYFVERKSLQPGSPIVFSDDFEKTPCFVEVGYALPDCEVRITHDGRVLPEKYLGAIEIRGGNVTQGYYGLPEETARLFADDCWLKTGDLGFLIGERLVFTARNKHMIIINGQNYFPHDLENILLTIPEMELGKLVVTSCWNEKKQKEELLIFVIFKEELTAFIPLKYQLLRTLVAEVGLSPDHIIPVRKIPKTTSGKVQHYILTDAYREGEYEDILRELAVIDQKVMS